jgi:hypothetical protein
MALARVLVPQQPELLETSGSPQVNLDSITVQIYQLAKEEREE